MWVSTIFKGIPFKNKKKTVVIAEKGAFHTLPFTREPLSDVVQDLVATARGDAPATLVVRNARLVNVCSGEIVDNTNIAVQNSRIAYVGPNEPYAIDERTTVVDAEGRFVAPGFLDGHCHIESTQLTVTQFARAVLPLGTTGVFFDAHEIANVLGLPGLRLMLDEARSTPLRAYMQVASCVPASNLDLETPGAVFGPKEIAEALSWGPDVIGLGEVMNFPGVVAGDPLMIQEIQATLNAGKVVDGHYTWPADDRLNAYAAAGVNSDHEITTPEGVRERLRLGMYTMLRRGSAWHDVAATIRAHTEWGLDSRRMILVTDDRSSESLLEEGHMNFVVRHAIQQGLRPVTAVQMATINAAERFGVSQDVGAVIPGAFADMIILDGNLADVNVVTTIAAGRIVAVDGQLTADLPPYAYPESATNTVRLTRPLTPGDFTLRVPDKLRGTSVQVRAIRVVENQAETQEDVVTLPVRDDGTLVMQGSDVCTIAVAQRHGKKTNSVALGVVAGLNVRKPMALATTVAHDSHNLMIIGTCNELMADAGNQLARIGGGVLVSVRRGHDADANVTTAELPLPVAGLMSAEPYEHVAHQSKSISEKLKKAGCDLNYAFMTISLLALVVIPQLRISDKGLVRVDGEGFSLVDLFVESP